MAQRVRGLFADDVEDEDTLPDEAPTRVVTVESSVRPIHRPPIRQPFHAAQDLTEVTGIADLLEPATPPPVPALRSPRPLPRPERVNYDAVLVGTLPPPSITVEVPPRRLSQVWMLVGAIVVAVGLVVAGWWLGQAPIGPAAPLEASAAKTLETTAELQQAPVPTSSSVVDPEILLPDLVIRIPQQPQTFRGRAGARQLRPVQAAPVTAQNAAESQTAPIEPPAAAPRVPPNATSLPQTPSRSQVVATVQRFEQDVRACAPGYHGVAHVRLVAHPSGRVTTATVTGGSVLGTTAGSCIAVTLRRVQFPPFAAERFVVHYPIQL